METGCFPPQTSLWESPVPADSRIPTGGAFSAVLWASDQEEGGTGDEEELLGRGWKFCDSGSFQGERKKVLGVHMSP